MRKLVIAAAMAATAALGGIGAWQAQAAAPAAPIPQAGPYTPIHPAACGGGKDVHCPSGSHWVCGPYGQRCWCTPC
jgi:hypothetical protein